MSLLSIGAIEGEGLCCCRQKTNDDPLLTILKAPIWSCTLSYDMT
jgi:hypothetical protein